jgi:hypothetical protein
VLQVLQVPYDVRGRWVQLIDVGAANQPVSTPTLALVKNTALPKSHVDCTISSVPTGARWELQVAVNTSATPPGVSDAAWSTWSTGYGNATPTVGPLPKGHYIHGRVRAALPGRITSAWSTPQTVQLDPLPAITGLAASNVTGTTALLTWTVGDATLGIEVRLDTGGGAQTVKFLPPGTQRYQLRGLPLLTSCTGYVRHRDQYGAVGPESSDGFTTTGVQPTLQTPILTIIKGEDVGVRAGYP